MAKPTKPAAPVIDVAGGLLRATWTVPAAETKPILFGELRYRRKVGDYWRVIEEVQSPFSIDLYEPAGTYQVEIRLVNDEGSGVWSDIGNEVMWSRLPRRT